MNIKATLAHLRFATHYAIAILLVVGAVRPGSASTSFARDASCTSCHVRQAKAWANSHHYHAMHEALKEFVRGNFDDDRFVSDSESYRFFREDGRYMVDTTDAGGGQHRYEVQYTFGWEPLQQYLVDFGNGKLQALNVAWNTHEARWFSLDPEENARPGDWLHWTGGAMNWNTMCAACHSTNVRQNYNAANDSFDTNWSSINVSCEACHGPGAKHVDFMGSSQAKSADIARIRADLLLTRESSRDNTIEQCASCHSLREKLTQGYSHTGDFSDHFNLQLPTAGGWFADGQIKEEVYVYASFLQSKMYSEGVGCNDCHDPHSLELTVPLTDNKLCLQCHESRYDKPTHHFHETGSAASQCINCHMTGRYYMGIDYRRDHSFRVPRPDLTEKYGTPNACNTCHKDKTANWADGHLIRWYSDKITNDYTEVLAKANTLQADAIPSLKNFLANHSLPDIVRATAISNLGNIDARQEGEFLSRFKDDDSELVRRATIDALGQVSDNTHLATTLMALNDPSRSVRLAAVARLAEYDASDIEAEYRDAFETTLKEYQQYLHSNRYFPSGLLNQAIFYEKRGKIDKAINVYQQALKKDPLFNPARVNLAHLMNNAGRQKDAHQLFIDAIEVDEDNGNLHYSLALLLSQMGELTRAEAHFERAAALMPGNSRAKYNHAIALQRLNRPRKAERAYLSAIEQEPGNRDYRYGIFSLYFQQGRYGAALPHARQLVELDPHNPRYRQLLRTVQQRLAE